MTIAALQSALAAVGYNPGPVDGIWGAKTLAALMAYGAHRQPDDRIRALATGLVTPMVGKDITTPIRIVHFLAQTCHESGGWRDLEEIWGPTKAQLGYDGRKDLGNIEPGDGKLYKGRGAMMITGRQNYAHYGTMIGLNLIARPEDAAAPDVAARLAVAFWDEHGLNDLADRDTQDAFEGITRRINGRTNGIDDRRAILTRLKTAWGLA